MLLMSDTVHEGGCVCGAVRYKVYGDPDIVVVCHCSWCQRRTGSAFAVIPKFDKAKFELTAGTLSYYRTINEYGRWLELGFCPTCGANIGFTQERRKDARAIDAGTFDDPSWIDLQQHDFHYLFTDLMQTWTKLPEGAVCYKGQLPT
ncbi:MAG: hypothetical protein ACI8W7_003884 [Gammaproteobacteria bacterium]|jgi:hypothetical protein